MGERRTSLKVVIVASLWHNTTATGDLCAYAQEASVPSRDPSCDRPQKNRLVEGQKGRDVAAGQEEPRCRRSARRSGQTRPGDRRVAGQSEDDQQVSWPPL